MNASEVPELNQDEQLEQEFGMLVQQFNSLVQEIMDIDKIVSTADLSRSKNADRVGEWAQFMAGLLTDRPGQKGFLTECKERVKKFYREDDYETKIKIRNLFQQNVAYIEGEMANIRKFKEPVVEE